MKLEGEGCEMEAIFRECSSVFRIGRKRNR
jgi:hypothetical protein